jgi:hypothetical protein
MIFLSQKQTDPVITYSASSATNTSQMLSMASKSDQRGVNIEHKLDMIENHLKQMVWLFIPDPEETPLEPLLMSSLSKTTIPARKHDPLLHHTYCNLH